MGLAFDPEIEQVILAAVAASGPPPVFAAGDWQGIRGFTNTMLPMLDAALPEHGDVTRQDFALAVPGGEILLRWYVPPGAAAGPAVLYLHGGGMICGSLALYDRLAAHYAALSGVRLLAVDYRLAPEHPHPVPVEDCFAALIWLHAQAGALGLDAGHIAVMGDSAGGGLAAAVALLARERGVALTRQILIYPMLDDRTLTPDAAIAPFASWGYDANFTGWQALLGQGFQDRATPPEAAPARALGLAGLAPAYIEVGELDIFRDEDVDYARRLAGAGVPVELHVHPGAPHAFERIAPQAGVSRRAWADRVRVLRGV